MPWAVTDFVVWYRVSQPALSPGADLSIVVGSPNAGQLWRVEQITCVCNSTSETVFLVYDRTPGTPPSSTQAPAGGTVRGNLTFGDFASPITVPSGGLLVCVWKQAALGAVGRVRLQVQILTGPAGSPTPVAA